MRAKAPPLLLSPLPLTAPASLVIPKRGDVSPHLTRGRHSPHTYHPREALPSHSTPALVRDVQRDETDQAELVEQRRDGAVERGKARPRGSLQAV